ncbi:MAG: DUF4350 domain-containing protein, partial [Halobacteriaceae archaeon]
MLSPDRGYSENASKRVAKFVQRGGTLVIAEDYGGHSNALLSEIGASVRFDGRPLLDDKNFYRSPWLPIAPNVANSSYTRNIQELTLNYPTVLANVTDARTIVNSSEFSYIDEDGDGIAEVEADLVFT